MQTTGQVLPIGIDLGNFSSKVAALGRTGTQVLPNSLSNRETPTLVSFGGERRLVGEAATTQRTSNVAGTLWNIRALLGRVSAAADSAGAIAAIAENPYSAWQGFQVVPTADAGLATVVGDETLPMESVAAACLGDCIATVRLAAEQGLVRDGEPLVALAAPAWACTASQRAALANAATIAGINVADVLSEPGAAALFYATERLSGLFRELSDTQGADTFVELGEANADVEGNDEVIIIDDEGDDGEDGPADSAPDSTAADSGGVVELTAATVVLVDIGHGGTSASLVTFDNKARLIQLLDMAGAEVGGREIDVLMAERFQKVAEATQPGLVLEPNMADQRVLRARQRIFSATDESKKVLSANDTDTAMLEELADGLDVRCNTTREDLDQMLLSSGVLDAIMAPVEQVLQRAAAVNIKMDALELYGGTARVPLISARVLALANKYMDTPLIRRSLNGSEAIARGCALYAAMMLPTFNDARRIQLIDTTPYDISVVLTAPPPPAAALKGEASKLLSPEAKRQNSGDSNSRSRTVDKPVLHVGRGAPLPSPMSGSPSARLRISDIREGAAVLNVSYTDPAQLPAGTVHRTRPAPTTPMHIATYRLDIVGSDTKSQTVTADDDAKADNSGMEGKSESELESEIEVGFAMGADLRVICVQRSGPVCEIVALKTAATGVMDPEALAAAAKAEEAMAAQDAAVARAEAARNSLESAIYRYRDEVLVAASDGKLEDEAREAVEEALLACEDWLYEEETYGIVDAAVFEDRLAQIESLLDAHLESKDEDAACEEDVDN